MLHCNKMYLIIYKTGRKPINVKENIMFDFEKKYEELVKQVKQINDFWVSAVISSLKQFQK